jgi:hypothetical protein
MRGRIARWLAVAVLLTGLTALVTYPQIRHLSDGVSDYGDPLFNAWALAWISHSLSDPHDTLFDANIFYPHTNTLALSETLVLPGALVAPLGWAGAGPILLHNVTLLSAMVLSGLTMFLLVRSLTRDWRGALVAAVSFTLTPIRFDQYSHVQLQLTYLMPLALFFLHALIGRPTARHAVAFGLTAGGLFLSCVYYAIFFSTVLTIFALVLLAVSTPVRMKSLAAAAATAAIVALIVAAPAVRAYQENRHWAADRSVDDVVRGSAIPSDYLRAQNWNLLYPISHLEGRLGPQDATYMYYSTAHWKPLLNGYSGFAPPSYFELRDRMAAFPNLGLSST